MSVVGPPSLPAMTVDAILTRMGSPMAGTGKVVEQASRRTQIDDAFALGVWWVETNSGAAGVGRTDRNPGSVRGSPGYPSGYGGYTIYPSYAAAIVDWFDILKSRYIDRGLTSVYTICYPYVGTSSAPLWAAKVARLMWLYRGEVPPPAPKPEVPQHRPLMPILFKPLQTQSVSQELRKPVDNARIIAPPSILTTENRLFIIGLGLLIALLIALGGALIRRRISMISLSFESYTEPVTPLPALMVNQFSPVLERWDGAVSPLLQAVAETVSAYSTQYAGPVSEAGLPGQISRNRERFPRRVMLVPSRAEAERVFSIDTGDEVFSDEPLVSIETIYNAIPSRPGLSLPGRVPAPVGAGASSGSLLARYSNRA